MTGETPDLPLRGSGTAPQAVEGVRSCCFYAECLFWVCIGHMKHMKHTKHMNRIFAGKSLLITHNYTYSPRRAKPKPVFFLYFYGALRCEFFEHFLYIIRILRAGSPPKEILVFCEYLCLKERIFMLYHTSINRKQKTKGDPSHAIRRSRNERKGRDGLRNRINCFQTRRTRIGASVCIG